MQKTGTAIYCGHSFLDQYTDKKTGERKGPFLFLSLSAPPQGSNPGNGINCKAQDYVIMGEELGSVRKDCDALMWGDHVQVTLVAQGRGDKVVGLRVVNPKSNVKAA